MAIVFNDSTRGRLSTTPQVRDSFTFGSIAAFRAEATANGGEAIRCAVLNSLLLDSSTIRQR